jgi:hypothetical protein
MPNTSAQQPRSTITHQLRASELGTAYLGGERSGAFADVTSAHPVVADDVPASDQQGDAQRRISLDQA